MGDHILYSHNFFDWERLDITKRKMTLITIGAKPVTFPVEKIARIDYRLSDLRVISCCLHVSGLGLCDIYVSGCNRSVSLIF